MTDPNQLLPHEAEAVKLARSREFIGVSHVVAALQRDLNDPAALRRLAALALVRARRIEAAMGELLEEQPQESGDPNCPTCGGTGRDYGGRGTPLFTDDGYYPCDCLEGVPQGPEWPECRCGASESLRRRVNAREQPQGPEGGYAPPQDDLRL